MTPNRICPPAGTEGQQEAGGPATSVSTRSDTHTAARRARQLEGIAAWIVAAFTALFTAVLLVNRLPIEPAALIRGWLG